MVVPQYVHVTEDINSIKFTTKLHNNCNSLPYSVAVQLLHQVSYYSVTAVASASPTVSMTAWDPNTHQQLSERLQDEVLFLL